MSVLHSQIESDGRVKLPPQVLTELDLEAGVDLEFRVQDGSVRILPSAHERIRRAARKGKESISSLESLWSTNFSPTAAARLKMSEYVLDASAILATVFHEPGRERIAEILDSSIAGRINVAEALTKLVEKGSSITEAIETIAELDLNVIEFDEGQARKIAELRPLTRHLGLSLGDGACLAVAVLENATAVTADRNWKELNVCKIEVIR